MRLAIDARRFLLCEAKGQVDLVINRVVVVLGDTSFDPFVNRYDCLPAKDLLKLFLP